MPTKPLTHSASRQLQRGTLRKPTTPTRFKASARKLLSRHARDLQACIRNGQHLTEGDYGRILQDLEALQAATAKVITDLALMAGEA
jgi:hypothetical protein